MTEKNFVIVGANLAGGTAAAVLRTEGFDGRVILIGAEPDPPYERPPLSKEYLRGESAFDEALVRPAHFYDDNDIETRFGVAVTRVEPTTRTVQLGDGELLPYDKVLIATGGRNRRLPVPGADLPGVYDLRTKADADRIRREIRQGVRAVIVGMGFIGAEVAASLRQRGAELVTVEPFPAPLARVLGEDVGRVIAENHHDHGVEMIYGDTVSAFEGSARVERVSTRQGRKIDCDLAVVGVGIEPVADPVQGTDVQLDNGIVVDEFCRTNVDGIYAAGDVTNHYHPVFGRRVRVEHWHNALKQGEAAARSMLGSGRRYDQVHWFWSDQYELNIQYAGFHTEWDDLVVRGSMDDRDFAAFYIKDGLIDACVGFNRPRDVRRSMALIGARVPVDPDALRDEDVDLRDLAPGD